MQESLHGKPVQTIVHQGGNLRLIDVKDARRLGLRQKTGLNDLIDRNGQANSGLLFFGIAQAEIRKYIS